MKSARMFAIPRLHSGWRTRRAILVLALGLVVWQANVSEGEPMGTAWTYQGRLMDANQPADGLYDFQFELYDGDEPPISNQIGSDVNRPDVDVVDGYFTVELDFGSDPNVFNGEARWLDVSVRPGDSNDANDFVTLIPRQEVTPAPYAIYTKTADADNDWIISGNKMYSGVSGNVGIGTTSPQADSKLHVESRDLYSGYFTSDELSDSTQVVRSVFTGTGDYDAIAVYGKSRPLDYWGWGGWFEGGYMGVSGIVLPTGSSGYYGVAGSVVGGSGANWGVSGYATGSGRNYGVYGEASGGTTNYAGYFQGKVGVSAAADNNSVKLPVDAVSASEILDEPGAASYTNGSGSVPLTGGGTIDILGSRTITTPAEGYVLVIGTLEASASHTNGTTSNADFGVSDSNTAFPANQDIELRLYSSLPTGYYDYPVTVQGLFEVDSAGIHSFYLLGEEQSTGKFTAYDIQLSLIYVPTEYGTVDPTVAAATMVADSEAAAGTPLTAGEMAAERAESQAFNAARIERELAEMRAELEDLKQEFEKKR